MSVFYIGFENSESMDRIKELGVDSDPISHALEKRISSPEAVDFLTELDISVEKIKRHVALDKVILLKDILSIGYEFLEGDIDDIPSIKYQDILNSIRYLTNVKEDYLLEYSAKKVLQIVMYLKTEKMTLNDLAHGDRHTILENFYPYTGNTKYLNLSKWLDIAPITSIDIKSKSSKKEEIEYLISEIRKTYKAEQYVPYILTTFLIKRIFNDSKIEKRIKNKKIKHLEYIEHEGMVSYNPDVLQLNIPGKHFGYELNFK